MQKRMRTPVTLLAEEGLDPMINTIIFDIGNVLVDYDHISYVRSLWEDDRIMGKVIGAIWDSGYWGELDRGEDTERIFSLMLASAPEYAEEIRLAFENVGQCLHRTEHAIPWITKLKKRGFKVLYLSNYSEYAMQANPSVLDFLPYMDGGVFSCHAHMVKPDPGIYRKICDDYRLTPEKCVFIDDNYDNICAAEKFGLKTILFTGYPETKEKLELLLA